MTLLDFVRMTRANWRLIFVVASLALIAAFLWTLTRPVMYASTAAAQVSIGDSNDISQLSASLGLSQKKADIYAAYVGATDVRDEVAKSLDISPAMVSLSGSSDPITSAVVVTGYAGTPEAAQALSQAGVEALIVVAGNLESKSLPQGSDEGTLVQLDAVGNASLPVAPYTPNYARNLLLGGVVGLLLGYLAAFIRMNLDRKLRSVDEVEELIETPVLAIVPDVKDLDRRQTESIDVSNRGPAAEAFRQLRTNFRFVDVDNPIRSVVITSANEGEGKSTVATNLARVLANAGQSTILVDADLRRPVVAGVYGVDAQIGLAQVLVGDVTAEEAMQESGIENLLVMSAGRVPHNPSELLGSHRMQLLLQELSHDHLVVLDAPPLLPVTDAALLAGIADGAIVVFAIGQTYKEQARLAKRRLGQTGGRMLGVVLNRAPLRGLGAVVYGYGYGSYTSSYDEGPTSKPGARKKPDPREDRQPRKVMRGRELAALVALLVIDILVVVLGYRAHTGALPPLQRSAASFAVDPASTELPTGDPSVEDDVVGPVLLGVNAAGDVLRATRGACEARFDNPARIWAGNVDDGVALLPVDPPAIHEVLGLMVYADGKLRVSGLDEDCLPVTFDSTDSGASWVPSDAAGVWRLSPDVEALTVTGPAGAPVKVPCPASQIVNLPGQKAVASCASQTFFPLATGGRPQGVSAGDYDQLSATAGFDDGSYFLLGARTECTASLAILVATEPTPEELTCFDEDKAPLAIASAGNLLVIQLGNDLRVSRDEGETFKPVGEPSPADGSSAAAS